MLDEEFLFLNFAETCCQKYHRKMLFAASCVFLCSKRPFKAFAYPETI